MTERVVVPTRDQALGILETHHDEVAALIGSLSDEDFCKPGTIEGGDWSAKDLISHLVSWERMALETVEDWRERGYPRIHERYAAASGIDEFNAQILAEHQTAESQHARRSFAETSDSVVIIIAGLRCATREPARDPQG